MRFFEIYRLHLSSTALICEFDILFEARYEGLKVTMVFFIRNLGDPTELIYNNNLSHLAGNSLA